MTETYLSLRRLENRLIRSLYEGESMFIGGDNFVNPVKVDIHQFYGIEINDFAVTVATTALWISESQMLAETERIISHDLEFLPLKSFPNIHEANALRTDWASIVPKEKLNYIMGNPPFIGANMMNEEQRSDLRFIFGDKWKNIGEMDYVTGWFKKTSDLIQNTKIRAALVSTNSVSQEEQVANLWRPLFEKGLQFDFAYKTFRWDSEASLKAHVHCVIIGFSHVQRDSVKLLFNSDGHPEEVAHINAYLMDAPDAFVISRSKPLCAVPAIRKGNQPTDGGNLIIEADELDAFLKKEPMAEHFIKKLIGAREYINNKKRYCLWLKNASPAEIRQMPTVMERIKKVREMRLSSGDAGTRKLADCPHLFRETNNPNTFIVVPSVSSEKREYVPMGFLDSETIPTNLVLIYWCPLKLFLRLKKSG